MASGTKYGSGGMNRARREFLAAMADTHQNAREAVQLAIKRAPEVAEDIRRLARALKIK